MTRLKFFLLALIFIIFLNGCGKNSYENNFETLEDLNKPQYKIGAVVGAASEPYVGKFFPNAEEKQFNGISDMTVALEQGQVDGIVYTRATLENILAEKPNAFQILDEPLGYTDLHMTISPNTQIKNLEKEVNEFLKAKKADGTLEQVYKYWAVEHKTEMPEIKQIKSPTKKLIVGAMGTMMPTDFYVGTRLVGSDIELVKRFAAEYGYEIEFRVEDFTSLLTDNEVGKIDMIAGSVMYTEERAERVIFPETPLYSMPISIMTKKDGVIVQIEGATEKNFFESVKESFEKTLICEDRYKMILDGLKVTLILSVGSLILGTILGFIFCMMKRSKIKIISKLTECFIALISGLPIVLTLMICFYIVFADFGLNEITVAIIAFSIDFGCYLAIILNSGIESVSRGEIEAAEAIGFSNFDIFKKIIFPQAVKNIFGVYRRHIISLIKITSIVGYIAVQDLTKVSDIIRARTFDAFFSLIFTAAIYFLIARICILLLDAADKKMHGRKKIEQ